jgi:signal transduction histidine kinase
MARDKEEPSSDDEARRSPIVSSGLAVVFVIAATGIGRELQLVWGTSGGHPYLLQLPAIMVAAWVGGIVPGLVATGLGTLSILYYSLEPARSLHAHHLGDIVALAIFFGCGVVVSVLAEWVHAARRREERLRRAREALLALVAHDLRNPLSSILLVSQSIRRHPDRVLERLDSIERAAGRMDSLIRDLVDASVLDRDGNLSIIWADESVPSILTDAIVSVTARAASKSIKITTDVDRSVPLIRCDRARVLQVLTNLLDNAIKFTPESGHIAVRATLLDAFVRIEVSDTGPGIKPEHQGEVFRRHWSGRGVGSGAGLGLYIARGIVRAHGGRLWVHSEPGHGTSFFATFPATSAASLPQREPAHRFHLS